jgi:predicted esterase
MTDAEFVHTFRPPAAPGAPTLLLLHGTGGDERDLLPLADALDPQAGVLSPRGKVLEHGMPRFFRRLAEGVFDVEDLRGRTAELAEFVESAADRYKIDRRTVIAVGFSNGANIAASLLLLKPGVLAGAILFRAMVPLVPDDLPNLERTPVLISNGRRDPLIQPAETERLAALLRKAGADVTLVWQQAGHELTSADVAQAQQWLSSFAAARAATQDPSQARRYQ